MNKYVVGLSDVLMVHMLVELLFLENLIKTVDWKKSVPHRRGDEP